MISFKALFHLWEEIFANYEKRALEENGSPALYYKIFDVTDNVTSVVIPVNEEYMEIKNDTNPRKNWDWE